LPTPSPAKGYLVRRIGDELYWISDGAYSAMFMVADPGVVACDAPPTSGERYLQRPRIFCAHATTNPICRH
jgi:hypothetical protein